MQALSVTPSLFLDAQSQGQEKAVGLRRLEAEAGAGWEIGDYAGVSRALKDPAFSVQRAGRWVNTAVFRTYPEPAIYQQKVRHLAPLKRILGRSMLFRDAPAHHRARALLSRHFQVGTLASHSVWMLDLAKELLDQACSAQHGADLQEIEFISTIARPFPALVMARLLGLPPALWPQLATLAGEVTAFIAEPQADFFMAERAQAALLQLQDQLSQCVTKAPAQSLLHELWPRSDSGLQSVQGQEITAQVLTVLLAAYDTTRGLLGNGLSALARHPEQWKLLLQEPDILPLAIRELLRFDAPVRYTGRRLTKDVKWQGVRLQRGEWVRLRLDRANHDPAVYDQPACLNVRRRQAAHLAFGSGPHQCLGAALTYMQAQAVFQALLDKGRHLNLRAERFLYSAQASYSHRASLHVQLLPSTVPVSEVGHG